MLCASLFGITVKNNLHRRTERRKDDEDIAERISGGIRLERSLPAREPEVARDQTPSPDKTAPQKRPRRAR